MIQKVVKSLIFVVSAFALSQCSPAIGDSCTTSNDCPAGAFCDNTVAEGYCTIDQCEKGSCPEDSVCIVFDEETAYCMETCGSNDDCRDKHVCRNSVNGEETDTFCYIKQK